MRRGLRAWNRVIAAVVGIALLTVGLGAVAWWHGDLARWWPDAPDDLDVGGLTPPDATWWSWTLLVGGAVLMLLALWWLLAHLRTTRATSLPLAGSDARGSLAVSTGPAADHLGTLARQIPRVTGYQARVVSERGRPVLTATVRVTPDANLPAVADRLTELTGQFVQAVSVPEIGVRVRVLVVRRSGRPRREVE